MHAMGGVIDIRRFGGLRRRMPVTHWTFLVGCLALAGVFPFAGFWSKDAILLAVARASRRPATARRSITMLYWHGDGHGVLLIDFYTFRPYLPDVLRPGADSARGRPSRPRVAAADDRCRWWSWPFGSLVVGGVFRVDARLRRLPGRHAVAGLSVRDAARAMPTARRSAHWHIAVVEHGRRAGRASRWPPCCTSAAGRRPSRLARLMNVFGLYQPLATASSSSIRSTTCSSCWPLLGVARLAAWFDRYVIDGLVDLVRPRAAAARRGAAAAAERPGPVLRPGDGAWAVGVVGSVVDVSNAIALADS